MSEYRTIGNFGRNTYQERNDPLTYCLSNKLDNNFLHGGQASIIGPYDRPCQLYMSEYCAKKWDDFCEVASSDNTTSFPNTASAFVYNDMSTFPGMTAGDVLIHNTASRKYLISMANCIKKHQPFDPTVPNSPMVSYWTNSQDGSQSSCVPMYAVDPKTIDSDPVMNKILQKPIIAITVLINIYNTMKRMGTLSKLRGTKLGAFYNTLPYFRAKGGV